MITRALFEKFTAFENLTQSYSAGINVFIGENGTGKTHIMKALYSACSVIDEKSDKTFEQKLKAVFLPNTIGRLVHRSKGGSSAKISIFRKYPDEQTERFITCRITTANRTEIKKSRWSEDRRNPATYIPVKDMLANAPMFRSLYAGKHIHFEEIYSDIIDKSLEPIPKGKQSRERATLLKILGQAISGKVIANNEMFYLRNSAGLLEFTLLAEGFRKLGLLYTLIQNETLTNGSVLFWDEPESNLNPKLAQTVVKILSQLSKMGVQIFIATHDYVLLKEFDLMNIPEGNIIYHSLYRDSEDKVKCFSTSNFDEISPNAIDGAFKSLLEREILSQIKK